jgi:hypothetical protein
MNTLPLTGILNKTPRYKQVGILRSPPPRRAITKQHRHQQQQQQYPMTKSTRTLLDSHEVLPTQKATIVNNKPIVMKHTRDQGEIEIDTMQSPLPLGVPSSITIPSRRRVRFSLDSSVGMTSEYSHDLEMTWSPKDKDLIEFAPNGMATRKDDDTKSMPVADGTYDATLSEACHYFLPPGFENDSVVSALE